MQDYQGTFIGSVTDQRSSLKDHLPKPHVSSRSRECRARNRVRARVQRVSSRRDEDRKGRSDELAVELCAW